MTDLDIRNTEHSDLNAPAKSPVLSILLNLGEVLVFLVVCSAVAVGLIALGVAP